MSRLTVWIDGHRRIAKNGLAVCGNCTKECTEECYVAEVINELGKFEDICDNPEQVREAIEKQKPRKVKDVHCDEYYCPSCGSENNCYDRKVEHNYCPNCGQKLLREDNDETY